MANQPVTLCCRTQWNLQCLMSNHRSSASWSHTDIQWSIVALSDENFDLQPQEAFESGQYMGQRWCSLQPHPMGP